jgi:hypothetical protein
MIRQLFMKWFGLDEPRCETCEILRDQLDESNKERKELLAKLLEKREPEPLPPTSKEELEPIRPQQVPWRVRQQMLEQEDRKTAELMRAKARELRAVTPAVTQNIGKLEEELGIPVAGEVK